MRDFDKKPVKGSVAARFVLCSNQVDIHPRLGTIRVLESRLSLSGTGPVRFPARAWHELTGEQKNLRALASKYGVSCDSLRRKKRRRSGRRWYDGRPEKLATKPERQRHGAGCFQERTTAAKILI